MTIKIVCNGKVKETQIIDVASGMELQANCTKAVIILDAKCEHPELILKFTDVELEVTGEVIQTFPPSGLTLEDVKAG
jgi:hypothetical protein